MKKNINFKNFLLFSFFILIKSNITYATMDYPEGRYEFVGKLEECKGLSDLKKLDKAKDDHSKFCIRTNIGSPSERSYVIKTSKKWDELLFYLLTYTIHFEAMIDIKQEVEVLTEPSVWYPKDIKGFIYRKKYPYLIKY